jgi:hypothetical protein
MSGVHQSHDGRIVRRSVRMGDGRRRPVAASSVAMEHEDASLGAMAALLLAAGSVHLDDGHEQRSLIRL